MGEVRRDPRLCVGYTQTPKTGECIASREARIVTFQRLWSGITGQLSRTHAVAQHNFGVCCSNGEGLPRDYARHLRPYTLLTDAVVCDSKERKCTRRCGCVSLRVLLLAPRLDAT